MLLAPENLWLEQRISQDVFWVAEKDSIPLGWESCMILVRSTREELRIQLTSLSSRSCCCAKKPVFVLSLVSFMGHTSQDTNYYVLFDIYLHSPLFPPKLKALSRLGSHEPLCFQFPAQCLAHGGIYIFFMKTTTYQLIKTSPRSV